MATSVPIDVMRDTKNMFTEMHMTARRLREEAHLKSIQADLLQAQASKLEKMYESWRVLFPDTLAV